MRKEIADVGGAIKYTTLRQTVDGMLSEDYWERFAAEYYQLKIRLKKLEDLIRNAQLGELDFQPTCDIETLKLQYQAMCAYMAMLQIRAGQENIPLA